MLTGVSRRTLYSSFPFERKFGNANTSQVLSCNNGIGIFPCPGVKITFKASDGLFSMIFFQAQFQDFFLLQFSFQKALVFCCSRDFLK